MPPSTLQIAAYNRLSCIGGVKLAGKQAIVQVMTVAAVARRTYIHGDKWVA